MQNPARRRFLSLGGLALAGALTSGCGTLAESTIDERRRRFVTTPYGDIACLVRGTGPAALFLHGFPLNADQWRDSVVALAPYRRCIAPDFLGLGFTRVAENARVDPETQVRMLVALLDALGVAAADVIANDSGGAVAQLLLAHHPERVRTLLLTNCDTEIESPPAAMRPVIELAKQGRFADEWLAPWLADPALARSAQGIGGLCYVNPAQPTDAALRSYFTPLLTSAKRKQRLHQYAVALENNALTGIGPALRDSRAPVRVVWGVDDTIFSAAGADHLAQAFGNSRGVRRLENAKLFWPEERPDVIAAQARILWESARG
jgi:pimeloyl-ACP methyl ester carboxylesterase